ncbi:MAG: serine/threonine-protein kinase, partial [Planctomycetota bacterium]|nr:serine/threonine-protein kinase [Planctomycetota bacterium]
GLIGQELGGYRITRRLGRGGRATVYLAEQQSMKREVALKVLSEEFARDESYVKRFVEEAQGAGRLQHPCVVQVFDVGSDKGQYFYSMEYFELGCVQDDLCQKGCLSVLEGLRMMSDVARGLEYAHSQKIVHRDIKPDNLLLDKNGNIRIGDLGHAINAENTKMAEGSIVGTPHYMSPEQAAGKPVDNRSDLYSLGCTAYKSLSGRYPFEGQTHDEVITRQMTQMAKALYELKPEVPLNLCRIIQRLMAKNPDDRYQTATELLQDLTPLLLATLQNAARTSSTHTQALSKLLSQVPGSGDAPMDQTLIIG